MTRPSILVVTAAPDDRPSTIALYEIVGELRRRRGVDVHLWYLRRGPDGKPPSTLARVVDDLRISEPAATFDRFGLSPLAGVVRGRQLRRWWREINPTAVLLDDAIGSRVALDPSIPIAVRLNAELPADASLEAAPATTADVLLVGPGADEERVRARTTIPAPHVREHLDVVPFGDNAARRTVRARIGIPPDAPLVVGWGDDAWFDGVDLFVRAIWTLEDRHGLRAHGLWLGQDDRHEVSSILDDEAARCGLSDRIHRRDRPSLDTRLCGDVVLLPFRGEGDRGTLLAPIVTGAEIVTFPVWDFEDPAVRNVDHLDLDAAARSLLESICGDREARLRDALDRLDVGPVVDRLLDAVGIPR